MKLLRVLLSISPSSGPYNQFQLAQARLSTITPICLTLSASQVTPETYTIDCRGNIYAFLAKYLIGLSRAQLLHLHHANLLPLALIARCVYMVPVLFTLGTEYKNLSRRHRLLLALFSPFISKLVSCSQSVYESLPQYLRSSSIVIRHGVDVEDCRSRRGSTRKPHSFIYAGRLEPRKNILQLLDAVSIFTGTDFSLTIAGKGSLANVVEDFTIASNNSSTKYLGLLSRGEVRDRLCTSTFFVSASQSDGMPIAVLEALACGCIPLLLNTKPHLEIISLGFKAILFSATDYNSISEAMHQAYHLNQVEIGSIVNHNDSIIHQFSISTMNRNYEEQYRQLI